MKILLLNPSVDAGHKLAVELQARKVALLLPANAQEAWQMLQLHGSSVDLGIIHKEGDGGDPGIGLISKIKHDPAQADLPVILTTSKWTDSECAQHQQSAEGVNAYLKFPIPESELINTIEAVLGRPLLKATGPAMPPPPKIQTAAETKSGLVLEEASSMFSGLSYESSDASIRLEAPDPLPEVTPEHHEPTGIALLPESPIESNEVVSNVNTANEIQAHSPGELPEISLPTATDVAQQSQSQLSIAMEVSGSQENLTGNLNSAAEPSAINEPVLPDSELASDMPYLFSSQSAPAAPDSPRSSLNYLDVLQPLGDAVVPGGAAQSPDVETLKKYLLLREQDVSALSSQLKRTKEQLQSVEETMRFEKAAKIELAHKVTEQQKVIDNFEMEKSVLMETFQIEIGELKFQIKAKTDKARLLELKVREAIDETERLKERVRADIRKIRVREKELENRLEIMKKDSEALIGARENKIIELKRKLDLLEFNMDLLQDQYAREKENALKLKERLDKAAHAVRLAGGLLKPADLGDSDDSERSVENDSHERAAS